MTAAQPSNPATLSNQTLSNEALEKLRQHFNKAPYPRIPLEAYPTNPNELYLHSLTTAYYRRNRQVIQSEGKVILDAGCGTGYKCLMLAEANPGARIVGIDISEDSIALAQERLAYHRIDNAEFYATSIEKLPNLGLKFDYINVDEVLYLLPDPVLGLQVMAHVLQPDGIMRANFHSALQREAYFRGQQFFAALGLMDEAPTEYHINLVRQTMQAMKDGVKLNQQTWASNHTMEDEEIVVNYLLHGDKGWQLPDFFASLKSAGLEFISMVNGLQWDLTRVFQDIHELPMEVGLVLAEKSIEEQLHLFELLHPVHRLLDLYCGLPGMSQSGSLPEEWGQEDWHTVMIHLHPQLCTQSFRDYLSHCILTFQPLHLHHYLSLGNDPVTLDSGMAACLTPLLDRPHPLSTLAQHWCKVRPFNPITLDPTSEPTAIDLVTSLILQLEELGYLMFDRSI